MLLIICEGDCEEAALPNIFRRLKHTAKVNTEPLIIGLNGKENIVREENGFEDTIRRRYLEGFEDFIILLDADFFFPPYSGLDDEKKGMQERAELIQQELKIHIRLSWAHKALESWFIAGISSRFRDCGVNVRDTIPRFTDSKPRNPERWLKNNIRGRRYNLKTQRCFGSTIDIGRARNHNRSFNAFLNLFGV